MLAPLALGLISFLMSGGADKLVRQFNDNAYDNPSLGDWAETAGMTGLGAFTGGVGAGIGKGILASSKVAPVLNAAKSALGNKTVLTGMGIGGMLSNTPGYAIRALDTDPYNNPTADETMQQMMALGLPLAGGMAGVLAPQIGAKLGSYGSALGSKLGGLSSIPGLGDVSGITGSMGRGLNRFVSNAAGSLAGPQTPFTPPPPDPAAAARIRALLAGLPPRVSP